MRIETGKTYVGRDTSRLRVYRINGADVTAEHPNSLRQQIMPLVEFEAWAIAEYEPPGI